MPAHLSSEPSVEPKRASNPLHVSDRIGRYRLTKPLSKGGMALVYEGRRESLAGVSPRVAIKFILPEHAASETYRELFINEARLGASMHHQNLVQILDFDADGDRWFLVMEYVEGLTLRRLIAAAQRVGERIPLAVIAEIGRQASDGLHYAHCAKDDRGRHLKLVHRDIKPSNLILTPHGMVKVLDFGISKGRLRQEKEGSVKGTWGYMAPEQAQGLQVAPTADVFGLATVLYELASLTPMFVDKGKDDIKRLLKDDHAARMAATLDGPYAAMAPILIKALQRDARARYQTAEEFGRALSTLLPDQVTVREEVRKRTERATLIDSGVIPAPAAKPQARTPISAVPDATEMAAPPQVRWLRRIVVGTALTGAMILGGVGLWQVVPHPLGPEVAAPSGARQAPGARQAFEQSTAGAVAEHLPEAPPPEPEIPSAIVRIDRTGTDVQVYLPGEEPKPDPAVEVAAAPVEEVRPPPVPVDPADMGTVVLGSPQGAEVYVDGKFVGRSPIERQLAPGRYPISIVTVDGRRRSFEVDVPKAGKVRKVWDFERQEWR